MSKTEVSGKQIKDGSIELVDLSATVSNDINTLKSDVSTLQGDVAVVQSDVGNLQTNTATSTYVDAEVQNVSTAITALQGDVTSLQTSVAGKASSGDVSAIDLRVAALEEDPTTKTYVDQQVAGLVNAAPAALDTLNELASALGSDANFATTVSTNIGVVAADVALVDARVASAEGDISSLQTDLATKAATASLADVATSGSYNDLTDKPSLFSGSYVDLSNKPSLATVATSGAYSDLSGTPVLATVATSGSYNDLADKPSFSSDLNGLTDVTIATPANGQVLQYNGSAWVNGAAPSTFSGSYTDLTNKPTIPSTLDNLSDVVVSSSAKGQFIAYNGTNYVNTRTIEADVAATVPMTLKGAASQTGHLLELQNSAGTWQTRLTSTGLLRFNYAASTIPIMVSNQWDEVMYMVAIGANSNTANSFMRIGTQVYQYTEFGFEGGTGSNGSFKIWGRADRCFAMQSPDNGAGTYTFDISRNTGTGLWNFNQGGTSAGFNFNVSSGSTGGLGVNLTSAAAASLHVVNNLAAKKGMIVKAAASQTANVFEVQASNGGAYLYVNNNHTVFMQSTAATEKTLIVRSPSNGDNAGHAHALDIQNGWGNTVAYVKPTGSAYFSTTLASVVPLTAKGAASQTANLFEAQNSSGTALFSVDKDGSVSAGTVPVARVSGLATVATSGSYNDLSDKPSIPSLTGYATESYVDSAVSALVDSAPSALNTLAELATALGNDTNFSTTITNAIAAKADSSSLATVATSGSYNDLSDKPSIPSLTGYATESYVTTAISGKADSSSLATVATSGAYADLSGAPSLATVATSGSYNDLADKPTIPDSSKFSVGTSVDITLGGITSKEVNAGGTTSNATEATLWSLTLADNTTYTFDISVCARLDSTTAKGLYGKSRFTVYRNNAGGATFADDFGGQLEELDTYGLSGYDYVVDVSGNDVRIRVTGAASQTVKWAANVRYVSVS